MKQAKFKILKYSENEISQWEKDVKKYEFSGELINAKKLPDNYMPIYFIIIKGE